MYIIITGPTATGKSAAAVELCKMIKGEIISADSMQVYKGMDIGTSKISREDMKGVPHYLVDMLDPEQEYSASRFKKDAEAIMEVLKSAGVTPVITGGTGLYINSVVTGLFETMPADPHLRKELRRIEREEGKEKLFELLKKKDPGEAAVIDRNNPRRLIRALEIIITHDCKISEMKKKTGETAYGDEPFVFILNMKRESLYEAVDRRVDKMMQDGLVEEVKRLLETGVKEDSVSMQAIGYKEIAAHVEGKLTLEEAVREIKQGTRNYAKRQITWCKKYKNAKWLDVEGKSAMEVAEEIKTNVETRNTKHE